MTREVRWGVLSTADIGVRTVIPALQRAHRSRVVAIGSREIGRARAAATALGIARAHGSYDEVLGDPAVDAVYIPLPNHLHLEWTVRAAEAGKHVLCEKPLALTSADAQMMVEACSRAGVHLAEAFMYRLHPLWQAVRELAASGSIGRLTAVESWFSYHNDDPTDIRNIREYGGGALYDIGCYSVSVSRLLFGREPTSVRAAQVIDPKSGVDITTSAILEFGDGVSTFTCSMRTAPDQRVNVRGTEGSIGIPVAFRIPPDVPAEILVAQRGATPAAPERIEVPAADQYVIQAETFIATVLDGVAPPFEPSDALRNATVIEQIVQAAELAP